MITVREALEKGESIEIDFFWKYTCEECKKEYLELDEEVSFCGNKDDLDWFIDEYGEGYITYDSKIEPTKESNKYIYIEESYSNNICDDCKLKGYMTLKEVLEIYKEEQPDLKLTVNYLDKNRVLLFTLVEETAKNILDDKDKVNYLDSKVFNSYDNIINVYYDSPVIIL